ncbi:unnamed protein product [Phytophthora fragariaefolia]|uniref:Unnamed protein product n=1 Tax=Phytophthora fragariaefolia TaxID=1490495 RepID=A0A9W7CV98_9STRA|nr:unnamed protein product [Phytophthora fragariaefolia]
MVHDRASGLFVPVFYILSTARIGNAYWDMIHFVLQATDQQLSPAEVICDFESALIDAVQTQFRDAIVLGCLFHMKQALRRAMKRYTIPDAECNVAMTRGVIDMLTVVNPEHVKSRGITWVKQEMVRRCADQGVGYSLAKWQEFWEYFERTWVDGYSVVVWNVHGMDNELVARTNNPLERFNRVLNTRFPTPHPSMATFVTVIKQILAEYVQQLNDIPRGRVRRVPRVIIELPTAVDLPEELENAGKFGPASTLSNNASVGSANSVVAL